MYLLVKLFTLCVGGYIAFLLHLLYKRSKYSHFPSLPLPWMLNPTWVLGHWPIISKNRKSDENLGQTIMPLKRDVGNPDLLYLAFFRRDIVFTTDIKILPIILSDRVNYVKPANTHNKMTSIAGTRALGRYNILTDPGTDLWAAKRRIMDPAFSRGFLRSALKGMDKVSDNLMSALAPHAADGTSFDISALLDRAAMEAISVCGFNWDNELVETHGTASMKMSRVMAETLILPILFPLTFKFPWVQREKKKLFREAVLPVRKVVKRHIQEELYSKSWESGGNILSRIIQSNKCSDALGIEEMVDDYQVFLFAGMETTSIASACAIFRLMTHPDVCKKAREEVDAVFGEKEELDFDDLAKLNYLEMVIKESMRLKSPVYATARDCVKGAVINGVVFPKGTNILMAYSELHTDERYWDEPLKFIPERFSAENLKKIVPCSYMPFVIGPRNCIGKNFAMLEMKIILSKILNSFDFVNPDPSQRDIEFVANLTLRPKNGIKVVISPRSS